jgi:hypothetical protein
MPHIPQFDRRWNYYKRRASKIAQQHFSDEKAVTYADAARWIPKSENVPFPAGSADTISDAAFGLWITEKGGVPDRGRRVEHFEKLTGLPISIWAVSDEATFERAVRRAAKEALSWRELAARARPGVIKIVRLSETPRPPQPGTRFIPAHARRHRADIETVWPGCQARIEVPLARPSPGDDDRRVWMMAEYPGNAVYILDPEGPSTGSKPASHVSSTIWRPRGATGYVMLPRGRPDYVKIDDGESIGTQFDLFVMVMNLSDEPEELRAQFDELERRLFQQKGHEVLDDAASLLQEHDVTPILYRQTCRVERRFQGREA